MSAVKTTSRLRSNDALAAGVVRSPITKSTGPSPPPKKIAPDNAGNSLRVSGASRRAGHRHIDAHNTSPLPRYSNPASTCGEVEPTSRLASGVAAPNKHAAANASNIPGWRDRIVQSVGPDL